MSVISANLEWLFTEAGERTSDRVRAAAAQGIRYVEIWGWRGKDVPAIADALEQTGVRLLTMIVDPQLQLTDPATHNAYIEAVSASLEHAQKLRVPFLVAVAGDERQGVPRAEQRAAVVAALRRAAAALEGSQVTLLLENLNSAVDHPGTYLDSVREGLEIVRSVGSPHVKLLLDAYHALVMGEDPAATVGADGELIGHVQLADVPGRHEPGTGGVEWNQLLRALRDAGYRGPWGMEYRPTRDTAESLAEVERVIADRAE